MGNHFGRVLSFRLVNNALFPKTLAFVQDTDLVVKYFAARLFHDILLSLSQLILSALNPHILFVLRIDFELSEFIAPSFGVAFYKLSIMM